LFWTRISVTFGIKTLSVTELKIPATAAVSTISGHKTSEQIQTASPTSDRGESIRTDAVNDSLDRESLSTETSEKERRTLSPPNHAPGPTGASMIIDVFDLTTYGPIGLVLGIPVGAFAGYWLSQSIRLEQTTGWTITGVAGIYCMVAGTEFLPLGTLVGALVTFEDDHSS
jgi:hypothetical protein